MSLRQPTRSIGWRSLVVAAVFAVGGMALGGTAVANPLASGSNSQQWAFGNTQSGDAAWNNASGSYSLHAFFGWHTILTQVNTSATTFQVSASRTMALNFSISYCRLSCGTGASVQGNLWYRAWETEFGSANFSTAGAVFWHGSPIPALAIVNASDRIIGNVSESWAASVHTALLSKHLEGRVSVQASAHVAVAFSPSLGLVPLSVPAESSWNSTSAFTAAGGWTAHFTFARLPFNQTPEASSGSLAGNVSADGTIGVVGFDGGPVQLSDGAATDGIGLVVSGPFHIREGFLLLPAEADAFGEGAQAWSGYTNGTAGASTSTLDFAPGGPHLGLLASSTSYAAQPSSVSTLGPKVLSSGPAVTNGAGVLQAQPESVPAAQAGSACLLTDRCAAPTPVGNATVRILIGLAVVAVVTAALIGAVVVERRKPITPPARLNEALYPSVAVPAVRPPNGALGRIPPPSEEDSLAHLW